MLLTLWSRGFSTNAQWGLLKHFLLSICLEKDFLFYVIMGQKAQFGLVLLGFISSLFGAGWHKLCEGTKGLYRKLWTRTKILSPNMRYFVAILRFVAIYALFGKKVLFSVNSSVVWARNALFYGTQCILYWVKFANLQSRAEMTHLLQQKLICTWQKFLYPFLPSPKGC